jgi:hypothetical protein
LWVLQVLLALHTVMGALWKFSNSEQRVPSLQSMPHGVWLSLSGLELLCGASLLLPAFYKRLGVLAPIAAIVIAAEMLLYCGLHLSSGMTNHAEMVYWLVVAAICAFIAWGRLRQPGS